MADEIVDEMIWDAGVVEEVSFKVTKAGKKYVLYKIGGDFVSDFTGSDRNLVVGDRIKYSYSTSGSEGQFKNLDFVERLPKGVEGAYNPAFYGMVLNNAIRWSLGLEVNVSDEEFVARVEKKFNSLWDLAERLKKEKKVN